MTILKNQDHKFRILCLHGIGTNSDVSAVHSKFHFFSDWAFTLLACVAAQVFEAQTGRYLLVISWNARLLTGLTSGLVSLPPISSRG
jgi:hypothetical protein